MLLMLKVNDYFKTTLVLIDEQKLRAEQKQKGQMWKEGLKVNHEIKERKMI